MIKVAIHSVPRSGSSWVGQIFNSSPFVNFRFQPLFSYAFKDYLGPVSSKKEIEDFFESIAASNDPFLLQQDKIDKGIYPRFEKSDEATHVVYKEVRYHHILENMLATSDVVVVGIVRNPYAVINSFLSAPREFRKDLGWDELEEWQWAAKKNRNRPEEFYGYEKWKETTELFQKLQKAYPERFYLLEYDDLLTDVEAEVERVFAFCGLEVTEQTKTFLTESMGADKADTYAVYKKKATDDSWRKTLDARIYEAISEDLTQKNLTEYLR